jgi:hypothetical protein
MSVDFDKTARALISLLEKTSEFKHQWDKSWILKQMIRRYYRFMQLKVFYPKKFLVPTIDIEIIWQTHLLRPGIYRDDCLRLFNKIIDHSLLLNDIQQYFKEQAFRNTSHLYEKHFHEEYCSLQNNKKPKSIYPYLKIPEYFISNYSYWDETYFQFSSDFIDDYQNPFSFTEADIILDAKWLKLCKNFMNYMILKVDCNVFDFNELKPIDLKLPAIKRLKKSYERFLYISAKYLPNEQHHFIHPTYAVNISVLEFDFNIIFIYLDRYYLAFSYARTIKIC